MKKYNVLAFTLCIMSAVASAGCGCSSSSELETPPEKVSSKVKDWKAYNLGVDHAKEVIAISNDEPKLQDALLEVRARITNIHTKLGAQSAADYERGFTEEIRTEKDSLARIIF